jgi:hypothetical protein
MFPKDLEDETKYLERRIKMKKLNSGKVLETSLVN